MSREEAWNRIDAIIARHEIDDDYVTITSILDYDALRMARKALEQEPSGDLISRQAVIDVIKSMSNANPSYWNKCDVVDREDLIDEISELPSVKQEPCSNCCNGNQIEKVYIKKVEQRIEKHREEEVKAFLESEDKG